MGAQPPLSSHAHFPLPPSTIPFHPAHLVPTCAETSTQRPGPTSPSASEKRRSSDLDHWPVPVPVLGLGPGLALLVCLGLLVCLVVFSVAGDMAVRCGAVRCGAVRCGAVRCSQRRRRRRRRRRGAEPAAAVLWRPGKKVSRVWVRDGTGM